MSEPTRTTEGHEMTTVYLVIHHDIEHDEVLGVFSTKEAAAAQIAEGKRAYEQLRARGGYGASRMPGFFEACQWMDGSVEAWEVREA